MPLRRRTEPVATDAAVTAQRRPYLEIQFHPGDIRKGVRYLFLSRRQVVRAVLGLAAYAAFLAWTVAISPLVFHDFLLRREYDGLVRQRAEHGERLQTLVGQLEKLQEASQEARLEMSKIYLAYGFSYDESQGQGGYPHHAGEVAPSIYERDVRRGSDMRAQISEELGVLQAFLAEVQSFEQAHEDQVRNTPSVCPLERDTFVLTSPFGNRRSPFTKALDFHAGIDLAALEGTPIHATADGVVAFAGRYPNKQSIGWWRYGNLVAIRHGERFITLYGHCDELRVRTGQRVRQGDVVATVGSSGWSTNPHLHYEVRRLAEAGEFEPVDPRIYILDHRWRDEELVLVRARSAPDARNYEPLPRLIR